MKRSHDSVPALRLRDGLKAGGAPSMWEPMIKEMWPEMMRLVPAGSQVLELGYGDGLLSCYVCRELGWRITGLESDPKMQVCAAEYARVFALDDRIGFHCCAPDDTRRHKGRYDAVFIKTVLYNSKTLEEYSQWLDWILSVLKPGGILINYETGRANSLTQWYRKIRRRSYTHLNLYTGEVEVLYDIRFEILFRRYYGGWSQFLTPIPSLYPIAFRIEKVIKPRDADNCFAMAMIGKKCNESS